MLPRMKHIILANMNAKLYSWPYYVLRGSVATDLMAGGSFNSSYLHRSFLNLTVKKNMKIGPLLPKLLWK